MNCFFPRTYGRIGARRKMGTPQKTKTLSLDSKHELVTVIDKKKNPKSEIAKDFRINPNTLTMIYKQRSAEIEAFNISLIKFPQKT